MADPAGVYLGEAWTLSTEEGGVESFAWFTIFLFKVSFNMNRERSKVNKMRKLSV